MPEQPSSHPQENSINPSASIFLPDSRPTSSPIVINIDQSYVVYHSYRNSQNQATTEFINSSNDNSTRARNSSLNGDAGWTFCSEQIPSQLYSASEQYSPAANGTRFDRNRLRPQRHSEEPSHCSLNSSSRRRHSSRRISSSRLAGVPSPQLEGIASDFVGRAASLPHCAPLGLPAARHQDFSQQRHATSQPSWEYNDLFIKETNTNGVPLQQSRRETELGPAVATDIGLRLGANDLLSQFPLEILSMVFANLHPLEVIRVSQTCKFLRTFLFDPKASRLSVWKPVLESIEDLPDCPSDLSEPQYIALLYNLNDCQGCGANLPTNEMNEGVDSCFELRLWICKSCKEKQFKSLAYLRDEMGYDEKIIKLLPRYWVKGVYSYHVETVANLVAEYGRVQGAKAQQDWIEKEELFWNDRVEHGNACRFARQLEHRKNEAWREEIQGGRIKLMKEKLTELGWEQEAESYFKSKPERFVCVDQALADDEWTLIQQDLIIEMEKERERFRQEMIGREIKQRIDKWLKPAHTAFILSQPPNEINPNILDLALSDEWRSLLCTEPFNESLAESSVEAATTQIPEIAKAWRKDRINHFLEAVRRSKTYSGQEVTEDVLQRASTIFRCKMCNGPGDVLIYPHTLVHYCQFVWLAQPSIHVVSRDAEYSPPPPPEDAADLRRPPVVRLYREEEKHILTALKRVGMWDRFNVHIVFDNVAHEHMVSMLDALGWSRDTPAAEMEERQPYVECLCECYQDPTRWASRRALRWKKAIYECKAHTKEEHIGQWFLKLNDDDLVRCEKREEARHKSTHFHCPWCHDHRNLLEFDKPPNLDKHVLKKCRGIQKPCPPGVQAHVKRVTVLAKEGAWLHYEKSIYLGYLGGYWNDLCGCRTCRKIELGNDKDGISSDSDA